MSKGNREKKIVKEIRAFCQTKADEGLVRKYSRYFTEGYDAYGLSKEVFLAEASNLVGKLRGELSLEEALRLGDLLFQSGKVESFLLKWKDTAPRKIFQYATEKMTKVQRVRFRAERKRKK